MFYTFPYLGIIFIPMTILYYLAANYYRRTSVEVKRLDSVLRSNLYSAYSGQSSLTLSSGGVPLNISTPQRPSLV